MRTSRSLLRAARASYEAARVAYVNGLGDIVVLLDTQMALAGARSTLVQAETAWYLALAQLFFGGSVPVHLVAA